MQNSKNNHQFLRSDTENYIAVLKTGPSNSDCSSDYCMDVKTATAIQGSGCRCLRRWQRLGGACQTQEITLGVFLTFVKRKKKN